MARLIQFDIGSSFPIKIEKWQQMKNGTGSLTDTLVQEFTAYANEVDGSNSIRTYESGKLKTDNRSKLVVRKKNLDARDMNVLWKVVYKGKRFSVAGIECINKASSDFLLTVESK